MISKSKKLAPVIILLLVILAVGAYFLAPSFFDFNKPKPTPLSTVRLEKKIYLGQIKTIDEGSLNLINNETGQELIFEITVNTKFNQKTGLEQTETEGVYKKITKEISVQDFKAGDQILVQANESEFDNKLSADLVQLTD